MPKVFQSRLHTSDRLDEYPRKNPALIGLSNGQKAAGYIKEFHALAQLDDIVFIAVRRQHEWRDPNSTSMLNSIAQQSKPTAF